MPLLDLNKREDDLKRDKFFLTVLMNFENNNLISIRKTLRDRVIERNNTTSSIANCRLVLLNNRPKQHQFTVPLRSLPLQSVIESERHMFSFAYVLRVKRSSWIAAGKQHEIHSKKFIERINSPRPKNKRCAN